MPNIELAGGPPLEPPPAHGSRGDFPMKTLLSALVALSVVSGYAASAFADKVPQSIWEQLDREGRGGHPT